MQNVNISSVIILDIIVVGLLILFAFWGRHRGLVKMITGVFVIILAITSASMLTKWTSPYISSNFVEPRITQLLLPEAQSESNTGEQTVSEPQTDSITSILLKLGLPADTVTTAINDFKADAANSVEGAVVSLSNSISGKVTYGIMFVIYFLLSLLVFLLLAKIIDLTAKLPVLNFLNRTGGLIMGAVWGYLIILVAASLLARFNILLTAETVSNTMVLNFIVNRNPLSILPIWQ